MMKKVKYYVGKAYKTFNTLEMRVLPGNIAFFFVLALIPIISCLVMIASYFSVSMDWIVQFINNLIPNEASELIVNIIFEKGLDSSVGVFNIVALFVASNGTYAIITASNTLYQVKDSDSLKDRIRSFILLLILLLLLIFISLSMLSNNMNFSFSFLLPLQ